MAYIGKIKDRNGNTVYPQTVVSALTDYTPMNVSQPSTLGISYLNGSYDDWANATHYRTIELPDARIVSLSVHVSSTTKISTDNGHHLSVLSVPTNIRPMYTVDVAQGATGSNGTFAQFNLSLTQDGLVTVFIPDNMETDSRAGYHAEFLYLSLKK